MATETKDALNAECKSLFESGVAHEELVGVILGRVANGSLAEPTWLSAAKAINFSPRTPSSAVN